MATKKSAVTGEAFWAKVFESNRDMKGFEGAYEEYDGMYTVEVKLDKANRDVLRASGSAKKGRFDDDGNFFVKFTRKHKDRFEWASGAPKVLKADGTVWSFADDGVIPNGSKIQVEFTTYTTSKVNGTRMETITVLEKAEMEERPMPPAPAPAPKIVDASMDVPF